MESRDDGEQGGGRAPGGPWRMEGVRQMEEGGQHVSTADVGSLAREATGVQASQV